MIINYGRQPLIFEFGLKGLMLLGENLIYDEEKIPIYLYAGLISKQPNISYEDCLKISLKMSKKEKESLKQYIQDNYISLSKEKIQELYSQSVGEVGIQPQDFLTMTLEEIDWAYEGFTARLEKEVNLKLLAIKGAESDTDYIRLQEDKGYDVGSQEEREQTFQLLWEEI